MLGMKTLFLGSGDFSRDLLRELLALGMQFAGVITRPDRPAGRGLRQRPTAVKSLAGEEGLAIFQPPGPTHPEFYAVLEALRPEVVLAADYGLLLPQKVLRFPSRGCVNLHPSLLPRYRGADPIRRALMNGEAETGVTLMLMDEGLDTGGIIASEKLAIDAADDASTLRARLARAGARLVMHCLPAFVEGGIEPRSQEEENATYAEPVRKEEARIEWRRSAVEIHNQVRSLSPRPGAYSSLGGRRVKILRALPRLDATALAPGETATAADGSFLVGTGGGALQLEVLQAEGKKAMSAEDFLRGYRPRSGEAFGGGKA